MPLQGWQKIMLRKYRQGQPNSNYSRQIGFKVDGVQKFGNIVYQEWDRYEGPLLLFTVMMENGQYVLLDLLDAETKFDGVVVDLDVHKKETVAKQNARLARRGM